MALASRSPTRRRASLASSRLRLVTRIVFSTNADYTGTDEFELYSIMPDGSGLTRLTNNTVFDGLSILDERVLRSLRFRSFAVHRETREPVFVQTFAAQSAAEAFDVGILRGLAWLNELQPHSALFAPGRQRPFARLRSVVHNNRFGQSALARNLIQPSMHT
jgi:hypothetical protein